MGVRHKGMRRFISELAYQTGRTIAYVALRDDVRRPVGWVVDLMWSGINDVFEQEGLTQKVIADMMGLTLRTYQRRVQASAASLHGGNTYWMVLYARIERTPASREEILSWFETGLHRQIVSILQDMQQTGWLSADKTGTIHVVKEKREEAQEELFEWFLLLDEQSRHLEVERLDLPEQERHALMDEVERDSTMIDVRTQSGVFQGLIFVMQHMHRLSRQTEGSRLIYASIDVEKLTPEQYDAVQEELRDLRTRGRALLERYGAEFSPSSDSQSHGEWLVSAILPPRHVAQGNGASS